MELAINLFALFLGMTACMGMLVVFLLMIELAKDMKKKGIKTALKEWSEEIEK